MLCVLVYDLVNFPIIHDQLMITINQSINITLLLYFSHGPRNLPKMPPSR